MAFLGIDFGTTNSSAGVSSGAGRTIALTYRQGNICQVPIPSIVRYYPDREHYDFGFSALNEGGGILIRNLKTFLGFEPVFQVEATEFDARDLAKLYLKRLLERLGALANPDSIQGVVASVPVRFSAQYRPRLRKILEDIGFKNVSIVHEPLAAAYYCLHQNGHLGRGANAGGSPVLVLDWGGGTLDISLLRVEGPQSIRELATEAVATGVGGSDMDEQILEIAISSLPPDKRNKAETDLGLMTRGNRAEILNDVERFKIEVLENDEPNRFQDRTITIANQNVTFRPAHVLGALDRMISEVQHHAVAALQASGIALDDLNYVIFVGGPFNSKFVRQHPNLNRWANAQVLTVREGPQFATTLGCTLLAQGGVKTSLACDLGILQGRIPFQAGEEVERGVDRAALGNLFHELVTNGTNYPTADPPNRIPRQSFQMLDLASPCANFSLARRVHNAGNNPFVFPNGTISVPVCHQVRQVGREKRLIPFNPALHGVLTKDILIELTVSGRQREPGGQFAAATSSTVIDGLPVRIQF
jgi:molecular chaperone DnaK (HSP70)